MKILRYIPRTPEQWKNTLGCLVYLGDYTTQICGDCNKPFARDLNQPVWWKVRSRPRGVFFGWAHLGWSRGHQPRSRPPGRRYPADFYHLEAWGWFGLGLLGWFGLRASRLGWGYAMPESVKVSCHEMTFWKSEPSKFPEFFKWFMNL